MIGGHGPSIPKFFILDNAPLSWAGVKYSIDTPKELVSMEYTVVGKLSDVCLLRKWEPHLGFPEVEQILQGRSFARWYAKNRKAVNMLAMSVPAFTLAMFGVTPPFLLPLLKGAAVPVAAQGVNASMNFWAGNGFILLHMLVIGFVTLIVTTFLKFTGRGDLAPLVVFVGGGIVLYEVLGLFKSIYTAVATFFSM